MSDEFAHPPDDRCQVSLHLLVGDEAYIFQMSNIPIFCNNQVDVAGKVNGQNIGIDGVGAI